MAFLTNDFTAEFKRNGEPLNIAALAAVRGRSFDAANDCWIDHAGEHVHIRNVSQPVSIKRLGVLGATTDALMIWERHNNTAAAFADRYGDDPTECGFWDHA